MFASVLCGLLCLAGVFCASSSSSHFSSHYSLPTSFNEQQFHEQIERTLSRIRKVLDREKQPLLAPAGEVPHEYTDKYLLTELLGNIALSSVTISLEALGLSHDKQRTLLHWVNEKEVFLRATLSPFCVYNREETKEVSGDKYVSEEKGLFGQTTTTTKRMIHKITEHFWDYTLKIKLEICSGGLNDNDCMELVNDHSQQELITTSDNVKTCPVMDLEERVFEVVISPYLRQVDDVSLLAGFVINRNSSSCLTPVRNAQIDLLVTQFQDLKDFSDDVSSRLHWLYSYSNQKNFFTSLSGGEAVFTPIVPLLDYFDKDDVEKTGQHSKSRLISPSSLNTLLLEEEASLKEKLDKFRGLDSELPRDIISTQGARVMTSLNHLSDIATAFHRSMMYVEELLRSQLVSSIGKEVTGRDVAEYTNFYARKILLTKVFPNPLAYPVRRSSEHSPEGIFTIEQSFPISSTASSLPLFTLSRQVSASTDASQAQMSFPLDASTNIDFSGDQFVHAYLHQSFSSSRVSSTIKDEAKLIFAARARQFSSFVLLLGKLSSSTSFDPQYAMVIRSKDELRVALNLAVIPTQKEFRDAIRSLSRSQQAFAKAFRSMQLEGSLFGAVVIQIKPQLERVLNLPQQSLQQEIELTEDLMELFIEHQIPSDLLKATYSNDEQHIVGNSSGVADGVDQVKRNVKAIQVMLERSREKDLKEKRQYDEYNNIRMHAEMSGSVPLMDMEENIPRGRSFKNNARVFMAKHSAAAPMAGDLQAHSMPEVDGGMTEGSGVAAKNVDYSTSSKATSSTKFTSTSSLSGYDYTSLPQRLQDAFELHGGGDTLRPTIVTVDENSWILESQKNVFSPRTSISLDSTAQKSRKKQAFDLLDALTRSGSLPVTDASLHVIVTATHVFDRSVMETLVQRNVNPLQRLEQSLLIMLQTLHDQPLEALVATHAKQELVDHYPHLFKTSSSSSAKNYDFLKSQ